MFKFLILLLFSFNLFAGTSEKEVSAIRIDGKIKIDGKLSEAEWLKAKPLYGFMQKDPIEGLEASEETELFFLYDDDNLYIGARMHHKDPKIIQAFVSRRDKAGNSEKIIISLDTFLDNKTAFTFVLNAVGVRTDYYHSSDDEYDRDFSYNPVWIGEANIDSAGWTAEIEIPFSQLRFTNSKEVNFGVNINHYIPSTREDNYWVMIPRKDAGWSSKFGKLKGLKNIPPTKAIEVLPYISNNSFFNQNFNKNNPFEEAFNTNLRGGLDLKYGISSNITLDAAFNPDFGQVEADPAEVNLSAFETFFDEQRPFFLERKSLFKGLGSNYFYSRRIGAAPRNYFGNADYADIPDFTQILGAAKITGRTSTGMNIGVLSAITNTAYAKEYFIESDSTAELQIEPLAYYNVARFQQEFGAATNSLGIIITSTERVIDHDSPMNDFFNKRAYSGGADYYFTFDNRTYELFGSIGASYIEGNESRMIAVQKHPAHFFQRPDASFATLDSNLTKMTGYAASINFNKISGKHWLFSSGFRAESPGYELNDLGSLERADELYSNLSLRYREIVSTDYYHSYNLYIGAENRWNYEGNKLQSGLWTSASYNFVNRASVSISADYSFRGLSDTETRGGPMMATPQEFEYSLNFSSDWSQPFTYGISYSRKYNELERSRHKVSLNFVYNFGRLKLNFYPNYRNEFEPLQYVTTIDGDNDKTFNKRYIFGELERSELSAAIRADYALTPDFTLEFYIEPFISDGNYQKYGELSKPRSFDLLTYGEEGSQFTKNDEGNYLVKINGNEFILRNYNFHYISMRSNFVLRWEWARGSTLFFVWQQNRNEYLNSASGLSTNDFNKFMSLSGNNMLALKISYWLPLSL